MADVTNDEEYLQSKLKSVFELISSDYKFLVPTYQREYKWNKENIDVLMQDIKDRSKDKKTHYMGSLALGIDEKNKLITLIDGQQRITTCLLLLRAVINKFRNSKKLIMPNELNFIHNKLSNKYVNNSKKYEDISYIQKILKNDFSEIDIDFKKSLVYKNFEQIKNFLNKLDIKEFDEFYTCFFNNFFISEIRFFKNLDQEMQIFENLNSKGMELSQWDLIKNYIYKNVSTNLWIESEREIDDLINQLFIFKASKYFENKKDDHLNKFFVFYCRAKSKLIDGKVLEDKGKTHKIFATQWPRKIKKFNNIHDLKYALIDISQLFEIYCLIISKDYLKKKSPLFEVHLWLENLAKKDIHLPLIINAIKENVKWENNILIKKIKKESKIKLLNFISDIDKYLTRLMVVQNITNNLTNLFDSCISKNIEDSHRKFIENISSIESKTHMPSLGEFKQEILKKNNWKNSHAIAVMRTLSWNEISSLDNFQNETIQNINLELIFPDASILDKNSKWFKEYNNLSWDDFKDKVASKVNKLGNYLLVIPNLNLKKVRDKSFQEKLEIYKSSAKNNLLIEHLKNHKIMNLSTKEKFTLKDIDIRTQEIANILPSLYRLSNGI